jgi:hypothetical protein
MQELDQQRSGRFLHAWLKHGESLTPFQRFAYAFLSVTHLAIGSFLGMVSWDCFKEGNLFFVLAGIASIVVLALGFLGFRNALRTSAVQRS